VKGIRRITPGAPQIAAGEAHKDARQASTRSFALDGFENFGMNISGSVQPIVFLLRAPAADDR
jgi:hypothetical protein